MSDRLRSARGPRTLGQPWCATCCTGHPPAARCPGELRATGAETVSWKVTVKTPRGLEGYGVLMAPSHELWRARIVTFPRTIWLAPGRDMTAKFVGRTRDEAERKARDFVRAHCIERGYMMRDELAVVETGAVAGDPLPRRGIGQQEPRFYRSLPVRFGEERPLLRGLTANLSESGLFVVTVEPVAPAHAVALILELEHCVVPLRGQVVWVRDTGTPGLPEGMGMRLDSAPRAYQRYVLSLE